MSKKLLNTKNIDNDIRTLTFRARTLMNKISKSISQNDIIYRIESILKKLGYNYDINSKGFNIIVSPNFIINGVVKKPLIEVGVTVKYNNFEQNTKSSKGGFLKIPDTDFELYVPVIEKMIADGEKLVEKYHNLLKEEKSSELLESILQPYMEERGVRNIYVNGTRDNQFWMLTNTNGSTIVRIPVDFSDYENKCDEFIKALKNPKQWLVNHPDSEIQVLVAVQSQWGSTSWYDWITDKWVGNNEDIF